jgi:predicted nucleic acid-binding protein
MGRYLVSEERKTYVIDTGPLSQFARSQWLGVLKVVLSEVRVVIPDIVEMELQEGAAQYLHLQAVLDASWIDVVPLDTDEQLAAFSHYTERLVGANGRNVGECGVLALAETTPYATAVLDDQVAYNLGKQRKVEVRRTLGLLCEAIRRELLTVPLVSAVADDLLEHSYRLPFSPGGFAQWAAREGLN